MVCMKEPTRDERIVGLYKGLLPASEIAKQFDVSERQVQRIVKAAGVSRTQSESYRLAIKQGRMKYYKKPDHLKVKRLALSVKLRHEILKRDGFACVQCGSTPKDGIRLEIDHKDSDIRNNLPDNLQVLCNLCNRGKAVADDRYSYLDRQR